MLAFYRKSSTATPLRLAITRKPPVFVGEHEDDVEAWLDHFESCARNNGWPRCNWPRLAYLYLADTWQAWFSAHSHLAESRWRVFRRELSRAVGPPNRHQLLANTWRRFARKPDENAYAHAHRFYLSLLQQLAGPNRPELLDRYLVVIYRKTRAVVDDVGSELGKAVFCAFVEDDVARLARPTSSASIDAYGTGGAAARDELSGNATAEATSKHCSSLALQPVPQLLSGSERALSSPSSLSASPSLHRTPSAVSMAQSLSNPIHHTAPALPALPALPNRSRARYRQRLQQRYNERIQELVQDFDDLARQFERFRPQPPVHARTRQPSTISLHRASSCESFDDNSAMLDQPRQHRCQSYGCSDTSASSTYVCVTCFNCGLSGHRKNSCRLPKRTAPALLEAIARACR